MAAYNRMITIDDRGDTVITLTEPKTIPTKAGPFERKRRPYGSDISLFDLKEVKFLVSNRVLRRKSKYFDMLCMCGREESLPQVEDGKYHITARKWHAPTFKVMLEVLHGHRDTLPWAMKVQELVEILLMADFYKVDNMIQPLIDVREALGMEVGRKHTADWVVQCLWLALRTGHDGSATYPARYCMEHSDGPIDRLGLIFPENVMENLESRRCAALQAVKKELIALKDALMQGRKGCSRACASMLLGILMTELNAHAPCLLSSDMAISAVKHLSYTELKMAVTNLHIPNWYSEDAELHTCSVEKELVDIFSKADQMLEIVDIRSDSAGRFGGQL